jgi:hypothetical protein
VPYARFPLPLPELTPELRESIAVTREASLRDRKLASMVVRPVSGKAERDAPEGQAASSGKASNDEPSFHPSRCFCTDYQPWFA